MIFVVSSFDCLDFDITQIKTLVLSVSESLFPSDRPAVVFAVFDLVESVVVKVGVSDKDQVSRRLVAVSGKRIDVNNLPFCRCDTETCVSHVKKF